METNFASWLQEQLDSRGWNQTDLVNSARIQGYKLTSSQISRILSGAQDGGITAVIAIAAGLGFSREIVFRARGWLLSEPKNTFEPSIDARVEQLAREVDALPFQSREMALDTMESVLLTVRHLTQKIQEFQAE
jgi:hypothetical protein